MIQDSRKKKVYRQQEASKRRLTRGRATGEGRGGGDEAVEGSGGRVKRGIKTAEVVHPRRGQIMPRSCPKNMRSEPPRGHEWALVLSRRLITIRANTTVRRQVEEGIIITMIIALSTWPTLVRPVAGTFNGRSGPNVDLDDAIEEFTRCVLNCSTDPLAVALPRVPRTEFSLPLGGANSRSDFHSQFLRRVRHRDGHCPCSVCRAVPFLRSRICETTKKKHPNLRIRETRTIQID